MDNEESPLEQRFEVWSEGEADHSDLNRWMQEEPPFDPNVALRNAASVLLQSLVDDEINGHAWLGDSPRASTKRFYESHIGWQRRKAEIVLRCLDIIEGKRPKDDI